MRGTIWEFFSHEKNSCGLAGYKNCARCHLFVLIDWFLPADPWGKSKTAMRALSAWTANTPGWREEDAFPDVPYHTDAVAANTHDVFFHPLQTVENVQGYCDDAVPSWRRAGSGACTDLVNLYSYRSDWTNRNDVHRSIPPKSCRTRSTGA